MLSSSLFFLLLVLKKEGGQAPVILDFSVSHTSSLSSDLIGSITTYSEFDLLMVPPSPNHCPLVH